MIYTQVVFEDNDLEDIIKDDAIHLVQDANLPREKVIACLKNALQQMQNPHDPVAKEERRLLAINVEIRMHRNGAELGPSTSSVKTCSASDDDLTFPSNNSSDEDSENDDAVDEQDSDEESVSSEKPNKKPRADRKEIIVID